MPHRYTESERQVARDYGRTKLDELRREGFTRVEILSSGDGNVCKRCAAVDGKVFLIDDAPPLPIHEETEDTWCICRCIYMPAQQGARLSRRKLPSIAVHGLESLGLSGVALASAKRRVIDRLRATRCREHGEVPTAVNFELASAGRAKVTVAACCSKLHERSYAEIAAAVRSRR